MSAFIPCVILFFVLTMMCKCVFFQIREEKCVSNTKKMKEEKKKREKKKT